VDKPVYEIAQRLNATADQVLLGWVKAKGAVAVTYDTPYFPRVIGISHGFLSIYPLGRAQSDSGWKATLRQRT